MHVDSGGDARLCSNKMDWWELGHLSKARRGPDRVGARPFRGPRPPRRRIKGPVNVLLTSSAEMKSLNRRFRGKDKPTDVLSFRAEPGAAKTIRRRDRHLGRNRDRNARTSATRPPRKLRF